MNRRITCLSDTHRTHVSYTEQLEEQGGFLLVHAGDADCHDQATWAAFADWLRSMTDFFKHVVFVPGNHDTYLQEQLDLCKRELIGSGVHLLVNEGRDFDGFHVWGSPYIQSAGHPQYNAFTAPASQLEQMWESIPESLDLLVTHGPANGILDKWYGDPWLFEQIKIKRPKLHVFGHIYEESGMVEREHTVHVNASAWGTFHRGPFEAVNIDYDPLRQKINVLNPAKVMSVT